MEMRQSATLWLALQGRLPRVARWLAWLQREILVGIILAPPELMLHASRWRMGWIGGLIICGNPLFGWIWTYKLPQPWESPELRLAAALSGLLLLLMALRADARAQRVQWTFNAVAFLDLPLLFGWMYLCNGGTKAWLASAVAMVLIYYQLVDWRIATAGVILGSAISYALFLVVGPTVPPLVGTEAEINAAVLGFAWAVATVLGFSTANQRRLRLRRTLTTIGIVAHELRTPLATAGLIAQALHTVVADSSPKEAHAVEALAERLSGLVRSMNHQIDMQVMNARQLHLTRSGERIDAAKLVTKALSNFPFRSAQEHELVLVRVEQDFHFISSPTLFVQVLANLLTNALRALAAKDTPLDPGSIVVEIDVKGRYGRLAVSDCGTGIAPEMKERIFEPFFTSDAHTGNGLGLAFCKRVVKSANGSIRVHSELGRGTTFVIELPLAPA